MNSDTIMQKDAATLIGCSDKHIERLLNSGKLQYRRDRFGRRQVLRDSVYEYIRLLEEDQRRTADCMDVAEAARLLGIAEKSIRGRMDKGKLEFVRDKDGYRKPLRASVEAALGRDIEPGERDNYGARLGKIASLLERNNIDPDEVGKVEKIRLNEWQGLIKGEDGTPQVVDMEASSVILTPKWAEGPAWPLVQQPDPVNITPFHGMRRVSISSPSIYKTAVIVPDAQFGYWRDIQTGALNPYHDEKALDVVLRAIEKLDPNLIIELGDLLDLPEFGKYQQEPTFAQTTNPALTAAYQFLVRQRFLAPKAKMRFMEGNHDRRMQNYIIQNAKAAFAIQRADSLDEWPVMSVPFLLRLEELDIEYLPGYPANITWINDNLACIHGAKVRSSGSTAAAVIDDERVSVIFGHVHRIELQHKTRQTRAGGKSNFAASLGCLSKIDGTVPSTKGAVDPFGRPVQNVENWQQAFGVVTYKEGDGPFHLEIVPIHNGQALFRGSEI
jgi:predicted phosphodiesterase